MRKGGNEMSFWKRFVGVALLFALGFLTGAIVSNTLDLRPAADEKGSYQGETSPLSHSFYSGMDLTDEQWGLVEKILEQCRSELAEIRKDMVPRIHAILSQSQNEIEPLLDNDQRSLYKDHLARWEEQHRRHVESKRQGFSSQTGSDNDSRVTVH